MRRREVGCSAVPGKSLARQTTGRGGWPAALMSGQSAVPVDGQGRERQGEAGDPGDALEHRADCRAADSDARSASVRTVIRLASTNGYKPAGHRSGEQRRRWRRSGDIRDGGRLGCLGVADVRADGGGDPGEGGAEPDRQLGAPRAATGPPPSRKPSSIPAAAVIRIAAAVRALSARIRPVSTAERAIGRGRKPVDDALGQVLAEPDPGRGLVPNTTVCTMIPGMTNCT